MTGIAILTSQQDAIASLIRIRSRALSAKDADAVADCQSPGFVCYSLAPPLVSTGGVAELESWFATWDGPLGYEARDLVVIAGEDVAFAHGLVNMSGRKRDGYAVDMWFRITLGLTRTVAGWKISHEHDSTPFYMDGSLRAAVDLTP